MVGFNEVARRTHRLVRGQVVPGTIQTVVLGQVTLPPGGFEIKLATGEQRNSELMRPRVLTLQRVGR